MDEGEEEQPLIQLPDKVKIFNKPQFVGQRKQVLTVHGGLIIALDLARSLTTTLCNSATSSNTFTRQPSPTDSFHSFGSTSNQVGQDLLILLLQHFQRSDGGLPTRNIGLTLCWAIEEIIGKNDALVTVFSQEMLTCLNVKRLPQHRFCGIAKATRTKEKFQEAEGNDVVYNHTSMESLSALVRLMKSIAMQSREMRRTLMCNGLFAVMLAQMDSDIIQSGVFYRTLQYDQLGNTPSTSNPSSTRNATEETFMDTEEETEEEMNELDRQEQAVFDQTTLYHVVGVYYAFLSTCRQCLTHIDEVGESSKQTVLNNIPTVDFAECCAKACLQFSQAKQVVDDAHAYYRRSGGGGGKGGRGGNGGGGGGGGPHKGGIDPPDHGTLLNLLKQSEIECALLLWCGAQVSNEVRTSIGATVAAKDIVHVLYSLSQYPLDTTASSTSRNILRNNHNHQNGDTIEAIVGMCQLLGYILMDERRLAPLLTKTGAVFTGNMIHRVLTNIVLPTMIFSKTDAIAGIADINANKANANSKFVAVVSTLSRLLGRIFRFTSIHGLFCTESLSAPQNHFQTGAKKLIAQQRQQNSFLSNEFFRHIARQKRITFQHRVQKIVRVMDHVLAARVRRVVPVPYVRVIDRVLALDEEVEPVTPTAATPPTTLQRQPSSWHTLKATSLKGERQRRDNRNLLQALHTTVAKHRETVQQENRRRKAGVWRKGDDVLDEHTDLNRLLQCLMASLHESTVGGTGGTGVVVVRVYDGLVFRLCVQTIDTPSLRPTSRAVDAAAGLLFNLCRHQATRAVLLHQTPHLEELVAELTQCVLRDSSRDDDDDDDDEALDEWDEGGEELRVQEVLPTFSTMTTMLLLTSLRHLATGCVRHNEKCRKRQQREQRQRNRTPNTTTTTRQTKHKLLSIIRRVIPALMSLFRQASNAAPSFTSSNSTAAASDQLPTLYKEALDLLTVLNPISILQLRHCCMLVSRVGGTAFPGLMSDNTMSQLRVERINQEEKRKRLMHGGIGGLWKTPTSPEPGGGSGESKESKESGESKKSGESGESTGESKGAELTNMNTGRRGRRKAVNFNATMLGQSNRGIMTALVTTNQMTDMKQRLVLGNDENEVKQTSQWEIKEDRAVRDDIAETQAEFDYEEYSEKAEREEREEMKTLSTETLEDRLFNLELDVEYYDSDDGKSLNELHRTIGNVKAEIDKQKQYKDDNGGGSDSDSDSNDGTAQKKASKKGGVDSVLWVAGAHQAQIYEHLLSQERMHMEEYEKDQVQQELQKQQLRASAQLRATTVGGLSVPLHSHLERFGKTYLIVDDNPENPYQNLISTESSLEPDDGIYGQYGRVKRGKGKGGAEELSMNEFFDKMNVDATLKRENIRSKLEEFKKEVAADPTASVDPLARAEKMHVFSKSMYLDGMI